MASEVLPISNHCNKASVAGDKGKSDSCSSTRCPPWQSVILLRDHLFPGSPGKPLNLRAGLGTAKLPEVCSLEVRGICGQILETKWHTCGKARGRINKIE